MKKTLSVLMIAVLAALLLTGCQKPYEAIDIRLAGLKGPTTMGMVQLLESAEAGTAANNYTFTLAGSADEVTPKLVQGDLDIVAVPANLAAVLYNNTNKAVKLLAVNTLGSSISLKTAMRCSL